MVNVFDAENFRHYLALVNNAHTTTKGEQRTLKEWSSELGYRSERSVGMVFSGQRLPSRDMVRRLSQILGHSDSEHRYFELLVELEQVKRREKDPADIFHQLERLKRHNLKSTTTREVMDVEKFSLIANWYNLVIKQLLHSTRFIFKGKPSVIQERLRTRLRASQIRASIQSMMSLGILKKEEDGRIASTGQSLTTPIDFPMQAARDHHRQMMDLAKASLEGMTVDEREIDSKAFLMRPEDLPEAKAMLREFRDRFIDRFYRPESRDVYQFNFQLFPHTKREKNEGENDE